MMRYEEVDVNMPDYKEFRPMWMACNHGYFGVVKVLLTAEGSNRVNTAGRDPGTSETLRQTAQRMSKDAQQTLGERRRDFPQDVSSIRAAIEAYRGILALFDEHGVE